MLNSFYKEINKLPQIQLNEKELIGGGTNGKVYLFKF